MRIIDLLRHGEPVGGRRYRGATDDPLSEEGWRQMHAAVAGDRPWRMIYTSPLSRCREFSQELGRARQWVVREDARLTEIGFGDWEGLTPDQVRDRDSALMDRFYLDPTRCRPRGAEELSVFARRVSEAWRMLNEQAAEPILVVAHAGVIRAILCEVLGIPLRNIFRIQIGYADRVRIMADGERPPSVTFYPSVC